MLLMLQLTTDPQILTCLEQAYTADNNIPQRIELPTTRAANVYELGSWCRWLPTDKAATDADVTLELETSSLLLANKPSFATSHTLSYNSELSSGVSKASVL
ncbi:hypothetical protein BHE74_00003317 [Ensete ventricosum]|nr:hypothetical protein GW17_00038313 [Ensete ventricosum]RWW87835.1 hypothetical protein BHE74_00003317 [Ensete ventricosum]RZS03623.1 hypothetical protein BHM03_00033819 [Ensete ventricosum]